MVKNEKFQCPSERGGPENFKNHPTFVPSAILGGVMASQTWETLFLGHPVEQWTAIQTFQLQTRAHQI